jgi:lipoyl(octanoyl) transferase
MTTPNPKTGRFIASGACRGAENMSVDAGLLEKCAAERIPFLRTYAWSLATLSLGYFQKVSEVADEVFCREHNVDIVRRPTGGGAILHQHELTFSLVLPENHPALAGTVAGSYVTLNAPLVGLLNQWQIPVSFRGRGKAVKAANCFAGRADSDIVLNGKKVYGSAQRRTKGAVMMHGSLLLEIDRDLWQGVFKTGPEDGFVGLGPSWQEKYTSLWDRNLQQAYSQALNIEFADSRLTPEEMREVDFSTALCYVRASDQQDPEI